MTRLDGYINIVVLLQSVITGTIGFFAYIYEPFFTGLSSPPQTMNTQVLAETVHTSPTPTIEIQSEVLSSENTATESSSSSFQFSISNFQSSISSEPSTIHTQPSTYYSPTPTSFPTIRPSITTTPKPTNTATPTPTNTPTPTVTPTKIPAPTQTSIPTPTPTFIPSPTPSIPTVFSYTPAPTPQTSLNAETLTQLINDHRKQLNMTLYQKNDYLCKVAEDRIPELPDEITGKKYIHEGLYERNLPYWITENMAYYPTEQQIFNFWMQSPLHRRAIEGNFTYNCGACNGIICIQLFTSFIHR